MKSDDANVNENDDVDVNESLPKVNDDIDVNENEDVNVDEDHAEKINESLPKVNYNIFDVRVWDGLRSNMKDELVTPRTWFDQNFELLHGNDMTQN